MVSGVFNSLIQYVQSWQKQSPPTPSLTAQKAHVVAMATKKPFIYDISHMPATSVQGLNFAAIAIAMKGIENILEPNKTLQSLLKVPKVIQLQMFESLSITDLNALELAIGKNNKDLAEQINKVRSKKIFYEMLEMFPKPAPISFSTYCPGKTDEEKIWLFRLFYLQEMGVDFSKFNLEKPLNPVKAADFLLQKRKEINAYLATIHVLDVSGLEFYKRKKFPDAICLLTNLKELNLFNSKPKTIFDHPMPPPPWMPDHPALHRDEEEQERMKICSPEVVEKEEQDYREALEKYNYYKFKIKQYPNVKFY